MKGSKDGLMSKHNENSNVVENNSWEASSCPATQKFSSR